MPATGGVSLGGFSFTIGANTNIAQQAMQGLQQRAQQTAIVLKHNLSAEAAVNTQKAQQEIAALQHQLTELQTQNPNKTIIVRVNTEQAKESVASLQQLIEAATRGGFRGAGLGAAVPLGVGFGTAVATAAALASGVEAATRAMKDGAEAAVQYNIRMETLNTQFKVFAGNAAAAKDVVEALRHNADVTPFNTQEVLESGQVFLRVARGSQDEMLKLVNLAEQLAATNPLQGLSGATFAIGELLAGQTESIRNRFNASSAAIQRFKEEGLTGIPLVQKVVESLGGSSKLVEELGKTFEGRASTIKSVILDIAGSVSGPLFRSFSEALGGIAEFLTKNQASFKAWGEAIGNAGTTAITGLTPLRAFLESFKFVATLPNNIGDLNQRFQQGVNPSLAEQQAKPTGIDAQEDYRQQKQQLSDIRGIISQREAQEKQITTQIAVTNGEIAKLKNQAIDIQQVYAEQNRTLSEQLTIINQQNYARQAQLASLDARKGIVELAQQAAGPSVDAQANLAAVRVTVGANQELLNIQLKRVQLAQEEYEIQHRGRTALQEEARAAAQNVQAIEAANRVRAQARQDQLTELQETQRGEQQLRQDRLEALQERLRGEGQARDAALTTLRDTITAERQLREDRAQAYRERIEDEEAAYAATTRTLQREQEAIDRSFQSRIRNLQSELTQLQHNHDRTNQHQLQQLDNEKRIFDQKKALQDAERNVALATTITGELEALAKLNALKQEQDFENKKAALQAKQQREQEALQEKQDKIQLRIAAIQEQQRKADEKFRAESEAREILHEKQQEANRLEARAQAHAEQAQRRAEDAQIRAAEEANRAADVAAQNQIKAIQEENRLADRAAQDALRELQKQQALEARADQDALFAAQQTARELQKAAEEEAYQRNLANQREIDAVKQKGFADERALLDAEEAALKSQNTPGLAAAAAALTRLNYVTQTLTIEGQIEDAYKRQLSSPIHAQIQANKLAEQVRTININYQLGLLDAQKAKYDNIKTVIDGIIAEQEESLQRVDAKLDEIVKKYREINGDPDKKPTGPNIFGIQLPDAGQAAGDFAQWAGQQARALLDGFGKVLNGDTSKTAIVAWVDSQKDAVTSSSGFDIASPSKWSEQIGSDVIEGFNKGINEHAAEVSTALFDVFNNAWAQSVSPLWDGQDGIIAQVGTRMANLVTTIQGYNESIAAALAAPFNSFVQQSDQLNRNAFDMAANMAESFANGWNNRHPVENAVNDTLHYITYDLQKQYLDAQVFQIMGWNFGIDFVNGWNNAMQNFSIPTSQGGGASPAPANTAIGGTVAPGRVYKINEGMQYAEWYSTGKVIPPEAFAREVAGAMGGMFDGKVGGGGITVNVMPGAVQVSGQGVSADFGRKLGNDILRTISGALRDAHGSTPLPVDRVLPGAG